MLEAPIISQVWDLLEAPDDVSTQQTTRFHRSWNQPGNDDRTTSADEVDCTGRRLSLKKLFKPPSFRRGSRSSEQQKASSSSQSELGNDESSPLSSRVLAGIPSTEIDLAGYIVAHGILSKEIR